MSLVVERFTPLVSFLEGVLGSNSEIVLHDFSDPDHSIVDIRNGHVSGRAVGGPATDLALKVMRQGRDNDAPHISDYISHSSTNRPLRSESLFIRDDAGNIVGMPCVNTDVSALERLNDISSELTSILLKQDAPRSKAGAEPVQGNLSEVERLSESTRDLVARNVRKLASERGVIPDRLTQANRIDVIRELDSNGMFLLKEAVADVAAAMGNSEPSVYRYLQKVRKQQQPLIRQRIPLTR